MLITEEFIEMGLYGSTLNKAQFEMLGQPYPPDEGWESAVIDRELSLQETNLFLLLRGNLALTAQEQIKKNYKLVAKFHKKWNKREAVKPTQTSSKNTVLEIYCDGACQGNPGRSGSGLAIYDGKNQPTLLYGAYNANGTNNTAELNALKKALEIASASSNSIIYSDSKYSIDSIITWAYGWKKNGWKKNGWKRKSGEIKNLEVIKITHELYEQIKDRVSIKHVKGHSGAEGNELADRMAVWAISERNSAYEEYEYDTIEDVIG